MDRRRFISTAITLSSGVLGGCLGGGGDGQSTPTPTEAPTPTGPSTEATATTTVTPTETTGGTPTPESVGQREFPDYNWAALEGTEPEFATEITLEDTQFHPLIARVPHGVSVPFVNEDSFAHTVTIPALDIDLELEGGASTQLTFDTRDSFDYVCRLHPPSMLGRIIVVEETPTPTPTPEGTPTPTPTPTPTETDDGGGYY